VIPFDYNPINDLKPITALVPVSTILVNQK